MDQKLTHLLFLDIETVSCTPSYDQLGPRLKSQWEKKAIYLSRDKEPGDLYTEKGAIYAEFGKIVAISLGMFYTDEKKELAFKTKALFGHDERKILEEFKQIIEKVPSDKLTLVAHNGKEFDFPYLCRRMLVNNIGIPSALDISGRKPWEIKHFDTLDYWKFGDRKHYTSLELLASVFQIPGSKDQMDGSKVGDVYYKEDNLEKISRYCSEDVMVTAMLYLKLNQMELPRKENIFLS